MAFLLEGVSRTKPSLLQVHSQYFVSQQCNTVCYLCWATGLRNLGFVSSRVSIQWTWKHRFSDTKQTSANILKQCLGLLVRCCHALVVQLSVVPLWGSSQWLQWGRHCLWPPGESSPFESVTMSCYMLLLMLVAACGLPWFCRMVT